MPKLTSSRHYKLAASLVCANMLELEKEVRLLEEGQADLIHFDVMDGVFVPRYGLHPEILQAIRKITKIPVDVHMMTVEPERYIPIFAQSGADYFVVHAEACPHLHRTITLIKQAGMKAGVALNPATPLTVLDYVLDDIDLVCLMAINPGILGHKLIPGMMPKIAYLNQKIGDRDIIIEIDGGVTFESGPQMLQTGATALVCGSSTIFKPNEKVNKKLEEFRLTLDGKPVITRVK